MAEPSALGNYLIDLANRLEHHGHHLPSLRRCDHRGLKIEIETMYNIKINGKAFDLSIGVDDSGEVHYHALPYVQFPSAIDLVKALIDAFPEELSSGHDHGHHHRPAVKPNGRATRSETKIKKKRVGRKPQQGGGK